MASSNRMSPNQREALSAVSTVNHKQEYLSSTGGILNVNASVSISGSPIPVSGATTGLVVAVVDGSGNQITSFGGGTQYANGAVQATPTGTVALGWDSTNVRALSTDSSGRLNINAVTGTVTVSGTVTANAGTNLNTSALALESGGNLATIAGAVTSSVIQTNNKQINGVVPLMGNGVTGTGSQRVTIASDNTAFSVNATLSAETTKVIGTVNISAAQTIATVTTVGAVTAITNPLPAGTNLLGKVGIDQTTVGTTNAVSLAQIGATTVVTGGVAGTLAVGGVTATGASKTGNPVRIGAVGHTANPSAVTDGQAVDIITDKLGKQVVVGSIRDLKANQVTTITASTAETTIVTSVSSVFVDMYGLIITNTSATAVNVAIKDATAGTTRLNIAVPAGDTRGFMLPEGGAIKQAAVTNNWTATVSASVTSVIITALTVQNL